EALLPGVLATEPAPQSLAVELAEGDTATSESTQTTSRPKWVIERPTQHEGKMAIVLQSDPYVDRFDCDRDLQQRTAQILTKYAEDYCRSAGLPIPTRLRFDRSELTAAVRDRFYTTRDTSVGPMVEAYQLTVFDDDLRTKLTQHVADAQIDQRLTATGMGAAWVLALVAACHGLCRFAARNAPDPFSKFNAKVT
ncbi:MAG: hypothetical protein KDA92_20705, partial [Planctomycetales bacterium]|nr:hypothetical protein [Planctomycetales bacterium]